MAHIYELVNALLDMVFDDLGRSNMLEHAPQMDLIARMRDKASEMLGRSAEHQRVVKKNIDLNNRILKRFTRKAKSTEPNVMAEIIKGRIAQLNSMIEQEKGRCEKLKKAVEFLADYRFDAESMQQQPYESAAERIYRIMGVAPHEVLR